MKKKMKLKDLKINSFITTSLGDSFGGSVTGLGCHGLTTIETSIQPFTVCEEQTLGGCASNNGGICF